MSKPTTLLADRLLAFNRAWLQRADWATRSMLERAAGRLLAAGIPGRVLQPGDLAPEFALVNQHGRPVSLSDRLAHGPVIVLFVRGGWCPFGTLSLRAYQAALPDIHAAGGDLLAITPQLSASCAQVAERDLLAFPLLTDPGNAVAAAYGVDMELDPALRGYYAKLGHDLPRLNGTGDWRIPRPATFVVGADRRVIRTHVEAAVHRRLEPSVAVADLLAQQKAHA